MVSFHYCDPYIINCNVQCELELIHPYLEDIYVSLMNVQWLLVQ